MNQQYRAHVAERAEQGIPALPLSVEQTQELCALLQKAQGEEGQTLLEILSERVSPGVDPAAEVKAKFLGEIVDGTLSSPMIDKNLAVKLLGTMMGGYNVTPLINALKNAELADHAVEALSHTTMVYDAFDQVAALAKDNAAAQKLLRLWADAEWFTKRPALPHEIKVKVFKVDGETNTDDFSPASEAWSRPDIPLHALCMGNTRFAGGNETIAKWRSEGHKVAFVGDVVGTGSSRKSATNSLLWHIGEDIPHVPNKRRDGVVIGGAIAPIFFNTVEDSGGLPLICDVSKLSMGDEIVIDTQAGTIKSASGDLLSEFSLQPSTLGDEFRAGGRIPLIIGRALTARTRKHLGEAPSTLFAEVKNPEIKSGQGFTKAQKIVGQALGLPGVLPGTACEPRMTTVLSQDTTGPMTADELKELACLKFQTPLFMQSFCHTAAYPKPSDVSMHEDLPPFIANRGGVPLRPGDGVCHSWINRLLVPDTVGTGGDSHTRFPLGVSFPAGSGLVAFAGALGFMPLNMPESVLVRFKGDFRPGITLRDAVNAIPLWAIRQGLMTVPKKNKKNIFNGRILEIEGLENLTVEQGFELTDASAERSAAAGCINLSMDSVTTYMRSSLNLIDRLIDAGYTDADTLRQRKADIQAWLDNPVLLSADDNAEYAAVIEIDLNEITEPILACPNDPDDVKVLSDVAGTKIDDVFLGSCMTNIGHFRAAGHIWDKQQRNPNVRTYVAPPTRMDQAKLKAEAYFNKFNQIGARIEVPGCSLCMGNQLRVPDGATVFSTSTRNFDNRMGNGAQVYLGSAELGAVTALKGELPSAQEFLAIYAERVEPHRAEVYNYLQFDEIGEFDKIYSRRDI